MNVLFVYSGNLQDISNNIIKYQGDSLCSDKVQIDYFIIEGKGIGGYLGNLFPLHKKIIEGKYDLVHAHYSFSGYLAGLATRKPIVVSLMGSDTQSGFILKMITKFFSAFVWSATIVKSERMKNNIGIKDTHIIPNGVDPELFKFIDKKQAMLKVGFDPGNKHIIFVADPGRKEKNFNLARQAFNLLNRYDVELHTIFNTDHSLIPFYMYAADVLLLTSLWEGSPNVVKEALACNLPVVSTDVGDVYERISGLDGCYICKNDPVDAAGKLNSALQYDKRTTNYKNAILSSSQIAKTIIKLYESVICK